MELKASEIFICKVCPSDITIDSGVITEQADDGVTAQEFIANAINTAVSEEINLRGKDLCYTCDGEGCDECDYTTEDV